MKHRRFIAGAALACLLICQASLVVAAAPSEKATLDLEWEAIPEAAGYEVELVPKQGGSAIKFQTESSSVSKEVPVGSYDLRIRSKEITSGVYGPWSEPTAIEVSAKQIDLVSPADEAVLATDKANLLSVEFKWNPIAGAKFYTLRIWPDDEAKAKEFKTKKTALKVKLSGMKRYRWYVSFETEQVNYAAELKARSFIVQGPEIERPVIDRIDLPAVSKMSWSAPVGAESYDAVLKRRSLDEEEWTEFASAKDTKETAWTFEKLPPGIYLATVTAKAEFRVGAESHSVQFVVKPTAADLARKMAGAIGAPPLPPVPAASPLPTPAAPSQKSTKGD